MTIAALIYVGYAYTLAIVLLLGQGQEHSQPIESEAYAPDMAIAKQKIPNEVS